MTIPTLAVNDPQPELRRVALAQARADVHFDRTRMGMVFPSAVPAGQGLGFRWALEAESLAVATELADVRGAWQVAADSTLTPGERWDALKGELVHALEHRMAPARHRPFQPLPWQARTPLTVAEHALLLGELPHTEGMARWDEDFFFGWQRIASDCPGLLQCVQPADWPALRQRIPLRDEVYARVRPGDTLDRAVGEHRLLVCDLAILEGIDAGWHEGWRRWLPASIALLALTPDRRTLLPVAIQCGQTPGPGVPVLTPLDGMAWRMARATYNGAESTLHGVVEHGAHCHMMMGAIAVAMLRTLAPNHPVRVLLAPHLDMTIGIAHATGDLYVPGGRTPSLQSISVEGVGELTRRCWKDFDWHTRSLDRHWSSRGLDAAAMPADFPVRDDLALYLPALRRLADGWVHVYYAQDADVTGDRELQDWVREVQAPDGAGIRNFGDARGQVETRADLADLLAAVLWRAAPWHAVVNYPVYETTAFAPAYPSALFGPPPRHAEGMEETDFLSLLPPESVVRRLFVDLVQVSHIRLNRLGHYPAGTFEDPRVFGLVDRFRLDLDSIARTIHERNRLRPIPWPFLDPSLVPASVHI
jgi:arachidonate 15-lipoxygenase